MSPIVTIQRRMMQLGRVRLGEKGPKGEPKKLTTFRFTSASRVLLEAVATMHGGTVQEWQGAPDDGYFEVTTKASSLDIVLPPVFSDTDGHPTTAYSQWFELWSGGGCQRRCDGVTETLANKPCMCNPEARQCKTTTRVSFMLPDIPGLGVWRLDSHGEYAAIELPGTLELLTLAASEHQFIPAVLRAEQRTKKVPGEGTRRFVVPVIDLPNVTVNQLASGDVPLALNGPAAVVAPKPALPMSVSAPVEPAAFAHAQDDEDLPGWGTRPDPHSIGGPAADQTTEEGPRSPTPSEAPIDQEPGMGAGTPASTPAETLKANLATKPQKDKLNVLVGKLRDGGHISNEQLYLAGGLNPLEWLGDDRQLHWSPLREMLTKEQAHALIERLERFEKNVSAEDAA